MSDRLKLLLLFHKTDCYVLRYYARSNDCVCAAGEEGRAIAQGELTFRWDNTFSSVVILDIRIDHRYLFFLLLYLYFILSTDISPFTNIDLKPNNCTIILFILEKFVNIPYHYKL